MKLVIDEGVVETLSRKAACGEEFERGWYAGGGRLRSASGAWEVDLGVDFSGWDGGIGFEAGGEKVRGARVWGTRGR